MSRPIRIAILENHQSIIDGYYFRLPAPDFEIVGAAEVYEDLPRLLARQPADLALMDVRVPARRGSGDPYPILKVIPELAQAYPEMAMLVISAYLEPTLVLGVIEGGASGFIHKDDSAMVRDLPHVVRSVVSSRGIYLSPRAREIWLQRQGRGPERELTHRQIEALVYSAANPDATTLDVANAMQIAPSTARNLLSKAYLRLGVSSRMAAVTKAKELGLITVPE